MVNEVRKFGNAINIAWSGDSRMEVSVLLMDSRKNWSSRRRLLRNKAIGCFDLLIAEGQVHRLEDVAGALDVVESFDLLNLSIVACNEAVIPCLTLGLEMLPDRLALINPKPSPVPGAYHSLYAKMINNIINVPHVKVVVTGKDEFSSRLLLDLKGQRGDIEVEVRDSISDAYLDSVRTPEFISSFIEHSS